jgi:hypothetical protein
MQDGQGKAFFGSFRRKAKAWIVNLQTRPTGSKRAAEEDQQLTFPSPGLKEA